MNLAPPLEYKNIKELKPWLDDLYEFLKYPNFPGGYDNRSVILTPQMFGAKADGTTDDTTAIQDAIDSLASTGGRVLLPPGDYKITSTLTIENPGLEICGLGGIGNSHAANTETNRGATIINKSGDSDAIKIGKDSTYLSDIVLKDFAIDGDSGTATDGNGIVLDSFGYDPSGVSSVKMYNISIHHVKHYGLYLKGNVFECSFYGLEFRYNEYGIYADADSGNVGEICFYGTQIWHSTEYGFYKDTSVTDINFFGGAIGLNGNGAYAPSGGSFHGVRFEQNTTYGIYVHGNGVSIFGGIIDQSGTGIYIPNANNTLVSGVYFSGNTTDINIGSAPDNTVLQGLFSADGDLTITNLSRSTQFNDNYYEVLTEAGAARTWGITEMDTTSGAMAVSLADGTALGQRKTFYFVTDGGDVTLTVAKHETSTPEVFTFDTAGSYLVLEWSGLVWVTIKNYGATV